MTASGKLLVGAGTLIALAGVLWVIDWRRAVQQYDFGQPPRLWDMRPGYGIDGLLLIALILVAFAIAKRIRASAPPR